MLERFKKTPPLEEEPKIDSLADVVVDAQEDHPLANQDVSDRTQDGSVEDPLTAGKVPGTSEFKVALQKEHDVLMSRIDELADEVKNTVLEKERLKRQEVDMAKEATSIKQRLEAIKAMGSIYGGNQ